MSAAYAGSGEGRRERAKAGNERGRDGGGRGIDRRRLWKVFVSGQNPLCGLMEGIGGRRRRRKEEAEVCSKMFGDLGGFAIVFIVCLNSRRKRVAYVSYG